MRFRILSALYVRGVYVLAIGMLQLCSLKSLMRRGHLLVQAVCSSTVLFIIILLINDYYCKKTCFTKEDKEFYRISQQRLLIKQTKVSNRQNVFKDKQSNTIMYLNDMSRDDTRLNVEITSNGLQLSNNAKTYVNQETQSDKFSIWIPKLEQTNVALSVNPFRIENVNICKGYSDIDVVIIVHSAVENFKRRSGIRQTWGNATTLGMHRTKIVFLLGQLEEDNSQIQIDNENEQYKDIVQGKFRDTYHNLTQKALLGLRWLQDNCESVKYVIKLDDDVFINTFLLQNKMKSLIQDPEKVYCKRQDANTSPIQRYSGKWKVNEHEFKDITLYPLPYCHGFFVMMGRSTALKLYQASKSVPFFWIDDFYVYGMLSNRIGLRSNDIYNLGSELSLNTYESLNCFSATDKLCGLLVGNAPSFEFMTFMWGKMQTQYREFM